MRAPGSESPVRAEAIRAARERARLSRDDAAEAIGVTPRTLQRWEVGSATPKPQQIPRIAAALRVSVVELLGVPVEQMSVIQARYRLGWTTRQAAAAAGVSEYTWNHIERGLSERVVIRDGEESPTARMATALRIAEDQVRARSVR